MLLCLVPAAEFPPRFRLGVGCVSSPVLVRELFFLVPAVTVECSPPLRIGVDGVSSPVLVRVLMCVVPAAECPSRFRLGVGGVSSPVLVRVLVCVVPAAECPRARSRRTRKNRINRCQLYYVLPDVKRNEKLTEQAPLVQSQATDGVVRNGDHRDSSGRQDAVRGGLSGTAVWQHGIDISRVTYRRTVPAPSVIPSPSHEEALNQLPKVNSQS